MTPSNYRAGGDQTDVRFAVGEYSLGSILVAQSVRGICAIFLGDDADSLVHELQDQFPKANLISSAVMPGLSKHRPPVSLFLSMSVEPLSSNASGMRCETFPCRRVVRNDCASSGYRWGVERKRALLEKEVDA
jgi:AraC family transcriptional regulator of adaptative response/methylated-DNA-[protein]-cysteine methyltransferase